jgi:hypothetical protein
MKQTNMNNIVIGVLAVVALGLVSMMSLQMLPRDARTSASVESNGIVATIYKSPTCGCCGQYASYMEDLGYAVTVEGVADMSVIKEEHSIPYELESCHTTEVGGYVVEGHAPEEAVQKLLAEKPNVKGIGMAGMPSGSPGMPGPKNEDFVIYEITHDGAKGNVFMTI